MGFIPLSAVGLRISKLSEKEKVGEVVDLTILSLAPHRPPAGILVKKGHVHFSTLLICSSNGIV
jgi:hypothetical protein